MVVRENRWHFAMPPTISPRNDVWETSAEIPYWWRVSTQIRVLLLIGCATCEICFNQSRALPHWVVTHHQYGISALVSQTSFHGETVGGIVKCHLFSQATVMAENLVILLWPISMGETNPWQGVCHQSINQSINQSFILTRYIKELKNSFNWNNWGQRDPCYSIICKLKRSEYDYTPGPCLWSCLSGLNELSKTFCIFELCGFLRIFVMFYSIFCLITTTQIRSQRESEPVPYLYLPDEILLQIFSFLSHKDLASCSRVCSQFYRISLDETLCKFLSQKFYKPGLSCSKAG